MHDLYRCVGQHVQITMQLRLELRHSLSVQAFPIIIAQVFQLFICHVCKLGLQFLDLLV